MFKSLFDITPKKEHGKSMEAVTANLILKMLAAVVLMNWLLCYELLTSGRRNSDFHLLVRNL